ncbi:50S ribosomal protein L5 [Patescibacteria group bacterium]|nr:50S ribosomal protein L5 [Patescibacteria group bacterium]
MTLKEKYQKKIIPELVKIFNLSNKLMAPKILKITVNVGINLDISKKNSKYIEIVEDTIKQITGQIPVKVFAKKAIAGFKIRQTNIVGVKTVLRSNKMYDFLEKFIKITLPRTRDFRGVRITSIDNGGNLSVGIIDQVVFPEIIPENIQRSHGLQVVITTSAPNKEQAIALFKLLGIPFRENK